MAAFADRSSASIKRADKYSISLRLRAALQYLTCEIVCIPYETTLALDLPAGPAPDGATGFGALIARYRAKVPGDGTAAGLRLEGANLETGARNDLKNKAFDLGGNVVYLLIQRDSQTGDSRDRKNVTLSGNVYRCPE